MLLLLLSDFKLFFFSFFQSSFTPIKSIAKAKPNAVNIFSIGLYAFAEQAGVFDSNKHFTASLNFCG
jgi:hypothetical protein